MRSTLSVSRAAVVLGIACCSTPLWLCAQAPMPGFGPVAAEEKMMWDNIKASNFNPVYAVMTPDFVYSGPEGLGGRDASLAGLKSCSVHSYSLGPAESRMIGTDAVLVSYTATVDTDCGPAPSRMHFAGDVHCTSTWVKRGGKWLALSHTEAPVMKMPPPQ